VAPIKACLISAPVSPSADLLNCERLNWRGKAGD
jgi:hypothetical protein